MADKTIPPPLHTRKTLTDEQKLEKKQKHQNQVVQWHKDNKERIHYIQKVYRKRCIEAYKYIKENLPDVFESRLLQIQV
jgi:hypothetical protein